MVAKLSRWGGAPAVVVLVIAISNLGRLPGCRCGFAHIRLSLQLHLDQRSVRSAHGESGRRDEDRASSQRNVVVGELLKELGKSRGGDRKRWVLR